MYKAIAIFSTFFPPHVGGVEYYSLGLANYFSENGYNVYVITTTKNYAKSEKYKVLVLDSFGLFDNRFPMILLGKKNRTIFQRLKKINIEGAIIQTRFYPLSIIAVSFLHKKKIPYLIIEHGTWHFSFSYRLIDKAGEWYEHIVTAYIKRQCGNFYGVSNACCKWLKHFGIEAKGVLYNSVNMEDYTDSKVQCQKLGDTVDIVFAGRLIREKGIVKLIKAFSSIHKTIPNTRLYIAGNGEFYEKFKNKKIDGVFLLGAISHDSVIELLKKSDIYCFPSDYPEGLPTTILEAAASRCFIIASAAGGVTEFVCSDDYGVILKENTISEIKDTLIRYVEREYERDIITENAFQRVKEAFTWKVVGNEILKVLKVGGETNGSI